MSLNHPSMLAMWANRNSLPSFSGCRSPHRQGNAELQPLTDPFRAKGYAVAIETALGEPLPEIQRFVAQRQIGLLALTTHGRSGLSRVLFGSVAQQLIQQLTIPILLFHPPGRIGAVTL